MQHVKQIPIFKRTKIIRCHTRKQKYTHKQKYTSKHKYTSKQKHIVNKYNLNDPLMLNHYWELYCNFIVHGKHEHQKDDIDDDIINFKVRKYSKNTKLRKIVNMLNKTD